MPRGYRLVREHPVESGRRPGIASSHVSLRRGMVGEGNGTGRPVRVWNVPSSHEDNRLSRPDRQAVRRTSDDTELEHNNCDPANFEGSDEHTIAGDRDRKWRFE